MASKTGKITTAGLKKLQKQLEQLNEENIEAFCEACAKELAARLLAKVIKRTPVGDYPNESGKKGGTLRRGWTSRTYEEAAGGKNTDATAWANSLKVKHEGSKYVIEVTNPVYYAPYVEFGHRTRDHKGWVEGRFFLTISEQEIQEIAPNVLQAKIKNFLKGVAT